MTITPAPFELPLDAVTISAVQAEMVAAITKHGHDLTVLSPMVPDVDKLVVLVEEIGEVARALSYDQGSTQALIRELLQVAAVAAGWAQALDERDTVQAEPSPTPAIDAAIAALQADPGLVEDPEKVLDRLLLAARDHAQGGACPPGVVCGAEQLAREVLAARDAKGGR